MTLNFDRYLHWIGETIKKSKLECSNLLYKIFVSDFDIRISDLK
jgi:hypothetical protein